MADLLFRPFAFPLALVAWFCGCAGNPPEPKVQPPPTIRGVERYFPLGDGYVYVYETSVEGDGARDMLLLRVKRLDAGRAQMQTGSGTRDLIIGLNAIKREGSGFVLRAPLRQGATWGGENGGNTKVDAVDVKVAVPAGKFEGCIRTVEVIEGDARGQITSVFCDGVGIAEMHVEQWQGSSHAAKRFVLKSFGPPVRIDTQR
ncbi:MAG: hypothetical protein CSA75_03945 [Sorangium cellulosum]|nr:MAG: hypothetical protein CSA75_03945 [Sorangium cellulosum]